tara:strand:+ start:9038 stop:9415 length:378 start_codon:yes stop_codon:yes gene_type:complete
MKKFFNIKIQAKILLFFAIWAAYKGIFIEEYYFPTIIFALALFPISIVIFYGRMALFKSYLEVGISSPFSVLLHWGTCICFYFLSTGGLMELDPFLPYGFSSLIGLIWPIPITIYLGRLDIKEFD